MPGNLPALIVGAIVAFYWARVLRMMRRSRRRVGKLANLIPVEPVGIFTRMIWVPVVACWIVLPLLQAFGLPRGRGLDLLIHQPVIGWISVFIALLAMALTLVCWKRMGRSWRIGIDPAERTPLILSGPYACIRHPIYALSTLLMLATVGACPSPIMIAVALLHLALLQIETRREESHLSRIHGAAYDEYCRTVGRFLPSLKRRR